MVFTFGLGGRLVISSNFGFSSMGEILVPLIYDPLFPSAETDDVETVDNVENLEMALDEDTKARFETWKSKTYALTVPLRIVALNGSLPAVWIKVCSNPYRFCSLFT